MKTRAGFVSNSSSSSFICDVCGNVESGWDMCLSEANMYECQNGHTFCRDEAINAPVEQIREYVKGKFYGFEDEDMEDFTCLSDFEEIEDFVYEVPECCCPICSMQTIADSDFNTYIMKKYNIDYTKMAEEIRDNFDSFDDFKKYLGE